MRADERASSARHHRHITTTDDSLRQLTAYQISEYCWSQNTLFKLVEVALVVLWFGCDVVCGVAGPRGLWKGARSWDGLHMVVATVILPHVAYHGARGLVIGGGGRYSLTTARDIQLEVAQTNAFMVRRRGPHGSYGRLGQAGRRMCSLCAWRLLILV